MGNVLVKEETLTQIADAIREKSGNRGFYRPREMPEAILEISTYSGEGADPNKPIRFYDPYGNLVYSYTVTEASELTELPALPEFSGLVGQEWNWSLEKIQSVGGEVEIGSLYITDDGSTRIYVELIEEALNPKIGFYQTNANSVWVDWGDGSPLESSDIFGTDTMVTIAHQYAHSGRYVIRLIPEEEAVFKLAGDFYSTKILHKVTDLDYSNKVYGNTIRKIEIGTGMTEFTNRCFNSASLESVTIPKDIVTYGTAFQGCPNIRCITFTKLVQSVSSYALRDCYSLEKLLFSESDFSFGGTSAAGNHSLKELVMASNVNLSYTDIFTECYSLKRVVLPKQLTRLGSDAFSKCSALKEVELPYGLTNIASGVFSHCTSLEFLDIPETVKSIESTAFYYCYALRKIKLPEHLTAIKANMFTNCYSLCEITIPKGVTSIDAYAFNTCKGMEHYYMLPETPPTLNNVNVFTGIKDTCKIHVPKGCLEAYQNADVWSEFASYMVEMED